MHIPPIDVVTLASILIRHLFDLAVQCYSCSASTLIRPPKTFHIRIMN
jgi:hypothetical protein